MNQPMSSSLPDFGASPRKRLGIPWLAALCLAFLAFESWIFLKQSVDWDLRVYHKYSKTYINSSMSEMYAAHTIEYPPLAILLATVTESIAASAPDCGALGDKFPIFKYPRDFANFKFVYRLEMTACVFAMFIVLLYALHTFLPYETRSEWAERVLVFVMGLARLSYFVLDLLDSVLSLCMLTALVLIRSRVHYFWSFLVLGLGIAFKIVPVVLVPLWILGSLPLSTMAAANPLGWARLGVLACWRGILVTALTLAYFVPFLLIVGPRSLDFYEFHRDRCIEFQSTYATFLGVANRLTGLELMTSAKSGSYEVDSSMSSLLAHIAPVLSAASIIAATSLFLAIVRAAALGRSRTNSETRTAITHGADFTLCMILVLLVFLLTNKVFSPQYVLWLIPLAALIPATGWRRRRLQIGFLALCFVTYLICPRWDGHVFGTQTCLDPVTSAGPTDRGLALLIGRTIILSGLIADVGMLLAHRLRLAWSGIEESPSQGFNEKLN